MYVPVMPDMAPDTVTGLGVLGRLHRNGFTAFPARCFREPVIRINVWRRVLVLLSSPAGAKHVLATHAQDFRRLQAGKRILGPIVGRGLLVSEGEAWRRQRRVLAPAFTPRTIPVLSNHIESAAARSCARLHSVAGQSVDLMAELQALSLDIAAASMFSLEAALFGVPMRRMLKSYMTGAGRPAPSDFLLPDYVPTWRSVQRAVFRRRWTRLIRTIIVARRRQQPASDARDLFDLIADAHGGGADDLLADEVATMVVAGHETTALALFWACLMLARMPDWQAAIGAEAGMPLGEMRHTHAFVREVLRLYPPAFMTAREAMRAQSIEGVSVPAGAMVLLPIWLLHRRPELWGNADRFEPARFLDGPEPGRFDYLPFGAGRHVCIGAQLAMTESVIVLARIMESFRLTLTDMTPVLPVGVISTRPSYSPKFQVALR